MNQLVRRVMERVFGWQLPDRSPCLMRIEAMVPVDPRRRLYLVCHEGRRALLLTGGPNDLLLDWAAPDPLDAARP